MTRKTVVQSASLAFVSAVTASFGMTSFVSAGTITHTGPNSYKHDKIKPAVKNKCDIETNNDVDIKNDNDQKAISGDANVKGNTTKDEHEHDYDPADRKDEHTSSPADHSDEMMTEGADSEYAQDSKDDWKPGKDESQKSYDHEDDHKSSVKNVTTGDAVNSNESRFNVTIETENECFPKKAPQVHKPSKQVKPSMKPKVTPPKAAPVTPSAGAGQGFGAGAGVSQAPQPVRQPQQPVKHVQEAKPPVAQRPPERVSNNVNITTNNNVSISNTNHQYAASGDANVSHNTHVGSVSTGDAVNSNSTSATVNISTSNN